MLILSIIAERLTLADLSVTPGILLPMPEIFVTEPAVIAKGVLSIEFDLPGRGIRRCAALLVAASHVPLEIMLIKKSFV